MSRRIGCPWPHSDPNSMSPVSACASKWIIEIRPWPRTFATPLASGKAIEWSPPRTTGIAPARVTFSTAASSAGQRHLDVAGVHLDVPGVDHPQVGQAVGAQGEDGREPSCGR